MFLALSLGECLNDVACSDFKGPAEFFFGSERSPGGTKVQCPDSNREMGVEQRVFVVLCSCPQGDPAQALATALVDQKLAACVNVLAGIRSTYRWQGKVENDDESLLLIKTTGEKLQELKAWVAENHPYEVPELLALPVATGLEPYIEWVAASVGEPED